MKSAYQVVVVGSGFGGSITACLSFAKSLRRHHKDFFHLT